MLTRSLIGGIQPDLAEEAAFRFSNALTDKIDAYRKEGKDPRDLLTSGKPDYMLAPNVVSSFMASPTAAVRRQADQLREKAAVDSGVVPIRNDAEYEALKPGTKYVGPDNVVRVK